MHLGKASWSSSKASYFGNESANFYPTRYLGYFKLSKNPFRSGDMTDSYFLSNQGW